MGRRKEPWGLFLPSQGLSHKHAHLECQGCLMGQREEVRHFELEDESAGRSFPTPLQGKPRPGCDGSPEASSLTGGLPQATPSLAVPTHHSSARPCDLMMGLSANPSTPVEHTASYCQRESPYWDPSPDFARKSST